MIHQHTINTPYPVGAVHCYTWDRDGELILFDTGPPTREAKTYFREKIEMKRLRHVVITHCHVDHYGLAHWLSEETGATIYLPYRDTLKLTRHEQRLELMYSLLDELGFDSKYLAELRQVFLQGGLFPEVPARWQVSEEVVENSLGIEVIPCPGHSQSDIVYVAEGKAITGDTLLENIFQSPLLDVDLETGERFNNYEAYCRSIVKLAGLSGHEILPGHRHSIDSVESILTFYISKLLTRVEQVVPFVGEQNLAKQVEQLCSSAAQHVFHAYLKGSEILFMHDFLAEPERLKQALTEIGLFETVAPLYTKAVEGIS